MNITSLVITLVLAALPAPPPPDLAQELRFSEQDGSTAGLYTTSFPVSITSADFNGDGLPDLAAANFIS
ncbi:MAG TPA: FG-GAP repeat protein, partial [Nitrospirota bacterium]|nr:FG-GAP repeat protein [Nitrospirota bacterium]